MVNQALDLEKINTAVMKTVREVGEFILNEGRDFDRSKIEFKNSSFNNLVSYVDKQAERKIVEALRQLVPEATFITEEGTAGKRKDGEYCWIIDPLDGTTNYLHGLPVFAISIALTHGEGTILGVVYEINSKECFHAVENRQAYCNDHPIHVSPIHQLKESLLATGFPYYHSDRQEPYLEIIKRFLNGTHGIRRLGSAAVDLAYVACGRLEGFFEYNLNAWDVAAGAFIVRQAGGKVTDFKGDENNYLFGRELCAAGGVHGEMIELIRALWDSPPH